MAADTPYPLYIRVKPWGLPPTLVTLCAPIYLLRGRVLHLAPLT
jgi:hypothetical protein